MRFMRDSEKEQLKLLVKACMLEISKLKMDLKKCRKDSNNRQETEKLRATLKVKDKEINDLQGLLREKDQIINDLKVLISERDSEIVELKRYREYFHALTEKPEKDLTSFQSQIYRILPTGRAETEELLSFINRIGFKDLRHENMLQILRNLERKGYFRSHREGDRLTWEKVQK